MTNLKKILITTESREIFVVRMDGESGIRGFCAVCAAQTEILTLDAAVSVSGVAALEIVRFIEAGRIHFWETAAGHLLICAASLAETVGFGDG